MIHDSLTFYWTVASGSTRKAIRMAGRDGTVDDHGRTIDLGEYPDPEVAMVSFATKMNVPWAGPEWFVDSGGYSTLDATGEYDASIEDYVRYVADHERRDGVTIGRYALRDWACDPGLLRANDRSERVHQNWTIRDHVECLELADEYGVDADPVAVLQGHDIREYQRQVDYYRDHGLLTDHVGVGSLKGRSATETRSILTRLREDLPGRVSIHAFGLTNDLLAFPDLVSAIDTGDTAAWDSKAYYAAVSNASTGSNRYTWDRVLDAYQAYRREATALLDAHDVADDQAVAISSLSDFGPETVESDAYVIAKCVCGTLIDPGRPGTHGPGCRHCVRSRETFDAGSRGLLCDPDVGEHHYLCPHSPGSTVDAGPASASATVAGGESA